MKNKNGKTMNINKAIERIEWRFKNSWNVNDKDIEAYNAILDYKEMQESINMNKNESLAKLWIHQLMLLNTTQLYSAERSIQVIDEILNKSVYDWCIDLRSNIATMRFNALSLQSNGNVSKNILNRSNVINLIEQIVDKNEKQLLKEFQSEVSEQNIIKFVEKQITRIINKYEK